MLWMQSYLFYCSVRLGVIVISILTLTQFLAYSILMFVKGLQLFDPLVDLFKNDDYYKGNVVVAKFVKLVEHHPEDLIISFNVYLFSHMATCLLAIYGALKLSKYFLLPLIAFEFLRVIISLACHIVLMIILKKIINLGLLVALTLIGGFFILYLAYNWCACVALYQICNLIRSKTYRALYGEDPFDPHPTSTHAEPYEGKHFSYGTIENVHVLRTPRSGDVDELKRQRNEPARRNFRSPNKNGVIAVLPANYRNAQQYPILLGNNSNSKRKDKNLRNFAPNINDDGSYGNFQWSELMVARPNKTKFAY